jgi:hypothetical protein
MLPRLPASEEPNSDKDESDKYPDHNCDKRGG